MTPTTYDDSGIHQVYLAHALPTSLPTDLAEVVERWQSLSLEIRAGVLELIRSGLPTEGVCVKSVLCVKRNLPTQGIGDEFDERGE